MRPHLLAFARMRDRPIYCGNFDYDATAREVEKLFEKFGDVERVDMKTGAAFSSKQYLAWVIVHFKAISFFTIAFRDNGLAMCHL